MRLKAVCSQCMVVQRQKYRRSLGIDHRERRSQARVVYPQRDTSRMGTARVKQKEEANTRIMLKEKKYGRNESK